MIEFTILIPVLRDDNRQPHCPTLWNSFESWMADYFGGFTMQGESTGCWLDNERKLIRDVSRKYVVAIEYKQEQYLYDKLAHYGALFGQQCLYVAQTSNNATLLDCRNYRQQN